MKVVLNGNIADYKNNYSLAVSDLILYQSKHFQFQMLDVIKSNLIDLLVDFKEAIEYEKEVVEDKKELTFILRKINFLIKSVSYQKTKESLVRNIYDFILKLEGNGLLDGFGFFSKTFGNSSLGNAERISLSSNKIS